MARCWGALKPGAAGDFSWALIGRREYLSMLSDLRVAKTKRTFRRDGFEAIKRDD
jgi:hypothetical protein